MRKIYLYFYTLKDIGFSRVFLRLRYEFRRILDNFITKYFFEFLVINKVEDLNYKQNKMLELSRFDDFLHKRKIEFNKISFKFLNVNEDLELPIKEWNNKSSRLWQFNLHYFDWSRSWLEETLLDKKQIKYLECLPHLIDDWIDFNPISTGDGWHSYTLSLRIRNWILLFRFFS